MSFKNIADINSHFNQCKKYPLLSQVFIYSNYMKRSLNKLITVKSKMDSWLDKEVLNKKLRLFDPSKELKKMLSNEYNCQNISNAWLKCYEIVHNMLRLKDQILMIKDKGMDEDTDFYTKLYHDNSTD